MDLFRILSALLPTPIGIIYLLLLTRWRHSRRTTALVSGSFALALTAANLFIRLSPHNIFNDFAVRMLNILPCFLLIYIISKYRDARMIFSFLTVCIFIVLGEIFSGILRLAFGYGVISLTSKIVIFLLVILVITKVIRKPFLEMMEEIENGWRNLCLIPFTMLNTFFLLASFPKPLNQRIDNAFATASLFFTMLAVYVVIFELFHQIYIRNQVSENMARMKDQIVSLQKHMETLNKKEKTLQLFQHDLRHYIMALASCIQNGNQKEALDLLNTMDGAIQNISGPAKNYTSNSLLNAVLSTYIQMAEEEGITVTAQIGLPDPLGIPPEELSVVFANTIENATHACRKIAAGKERKLVLTCGISGAQLLLEISNTCSGQVIFDSRTKLPMSNEAGHGIGSQSVAAFVEKNHGHLFYQTEGGWFTLRIILPLP